MTPVMMKTSQFSPPASALYKTYRPAGIFAIAGSTQKNVQQNTNLRNRQCWRIFFSREESLKSKTMLQ